jgi:hypothetical protein
MPFERERAVNALSLKGNQIGVVFLCNFQYRHVLILLVKSASMKTQTCLIYSISSNIFTNEMCFS